MIQRIQSVYLFLAFLLASVLVLFVNLWKQSNGETVVYALDLLAENSILSKCVPVLFFISALLSLITIFLYKNRQLQFVLCRINILTNFFLLGILLYVSLKLSGETAVSEKGIGMFIPIIVILLLVLANKAIKKDEDLVKSVDRLR
ncbi:DUF4293 domain-containing protein [Tenacibaculum sp. SG-28]|uniref:DUF4293 domain-containing protein n=1 Tax=Tenacibaculum sp. SG-28 TaxID=754426 RepID=UPI000CF4BE86|nr:DUF4293 domain-containing protein [Tenacibaculum sp. SG-28]PQJ21045.1 hypothetical protein BSU00_08470 [Tenacibaculum sp. SG-28]